MKINYFYRNARSENNAASFFRLSVYFLIFVVVTLTDVKQISFGDGTTLSSRWVYYPAGLILFALLLPKFLLNLKLKLSLFRLSTGAAICFLMIVIIALAEFAGGSHVPYVIEETGVITITLRLLLLLAIGTLEEFVFRKVLLTQLVLLMKSVIWPVIISAVLFSLVHVPRYLDDPQLPVTLLMIFAVGIFMGVIFYSTNNLLIVSFLHCLIDFDTVVLHSETRSVAGFFALVFLLLTALIFRRIPFIKTERRLAGK